MTISLKHKFVSEVEDGDDDTVVRPSNWNDEHDLEMASARILGRVTEDAGPVEELNAAAVRALINVEDGADVTDATNVASAGAVMAASTFGTDNRLLRSDGTGRGAQASGIELNDANQIIADGNTGSSAIGVFTGGLGSFQVRNVSGGAAMVAFHRSPEFAAYFGVDTDNAWKVGGWSYGANAHRVVHEGMASVSLTAASFSGAVTASANVGLGAAAEASGGTRLLLSGDDFFASSLSHVRTSGPFRWNYGITGVGNWLLRYGNLSSGADWVSVASSNGAVRFAGYGAGTLVTDSSGNITTSSDERLKDDIAPWGTGLAAILQIEPIEYAWSEASGFDRMNRYVGFSAQNIDDVLPEAVGMGVDGYLTLQDRPILAALVNAVKELAAENAALAARITALETAP